MRALEFRVGFITDWSLRTYSVKQAKTLAAILTHPRHEVATRPRGKAV
jgi:hypothetical protein